MKPSRRGPLGPQPADPGHQVAGVVVAAAGAPGGRGLVQPAADVAVGAARRWPAGWWAATGSAGTRPGRRTPRRSRRPRRRWRTARRARPGRRRAPRGRWTRPARRVPNSVVSEVICTLSARSVLPVGVGQRRAGAHEVAVVALDDPDLLRGEPGVVARRRARRPGGRTAAGRAGSRRCARRSAAPARPRAPASPAVAIEAARLPKTRITRL